MFEECTKKDIKYLSGISALLLILIVTSLICFCLKNKFEGYSTEYPLPYLKHKWGHVKSSKVVYPGSVPMNKLQDLDNIEKGTATKQMNKTLFKSTWSKNYANTGIWPDSTAPPKYGNGNNQNIYTGQLKINKPNYKTTCFANSPLTVEKVLKPMPNQYSLSFN